jgi:cytidine deaminase
MSESEMESDQLDLLLAHRYRRSLKNAPCQSNFRVVALIFLEQDSIVPDRTSCLPLLCWSGDRPYLLGTNAETCWIGNSICAERSALALLRWYPSATVSKIVIVTDAPGAIAPGCLCREFMASCDQIPWDTRIVLGGTQCQRCELHLPQEYQLLDQDARRNGDNDDDKNSEGSDGTMLCADGSKHDFISSIVTLETIYPHPSVYVRSKPEECIALGSKWKHSLLQSEQLIVKIARDVFGQQVDKSTSLHPISYVAAVRFQDDSFATSRCVKSLEYGCSLDAITQLAQQMEAKRNSGVDAIQIVQLDQFGLAHPPFAPGRAFLVEHGYGHVEVGMHDFDPEHNVLIWKAVMASELAPMVPDFVAQMKGSPNQEA